MRHVRLIAILMTIFAAAGVMAADEDPYLWLEEVENEKALTWAKERSDTDTAIFEAVPEFDDIYAKLVEIYNSRDRIPTPAIRGSWVYNFWQDAEHVRGIWRRTFPSEFVKDEPSWEIVLDLDALAEAEDENWVWKGADCLEPEYRRCMISLSRGGADATVEREFDTVAKAFVADGFVLSEAKQQLGWRDENSLWIGTDFGEGSLTTSGYARIVQIVDARHTHRRGDDHFRRFGGRCLRFRNLGPHSGGTLRSRHSDPGVLPGHQLSSAR